MDMPSEARLIEKLRAIEALHARPGSHGERQAAANARERILERLAELSVDDEPIEYQFSMPDIWSRRIFVALLRRYGIQPYRYRRQRRTTVVAKISERFLDETLWPQYEAFNTPLRKHLSEVTERIVSQVIHDDLTEATVADDSAQLSLPPAPTTGDDLNAARQGVANTEPQAPAKSESSEATASAPKGKQEISERNKRKRERKNHRR